ncbi:MAG TPA: hypothetical protein V6C76_13585 [Drouetiella sp.]
MKKLRTRFWSITFSALLAGSVMTSACHSQPAATVALNTDGKTISQKWKFRNEQDWIVDSIGRDIAEMLVFAKFRNDSKTKISSDAIDFKTVCTDPATNKYKYVLTSPGSNTPMEYEFTLTDYAWSPTNYEPFAKKVMSAFELKPVAASTTPADYLKKLATTEMTTLWSENDRLSKALSAAPLDSSLHQQAALLQATIDMLEAADEHSDTRFLLNRMAAHLSMSIATADSADLNISGKIADIALESLSGRDAVAMKKNDVLTKEQTDPVLKSWLRALKIRSSGDYRLYDSANQTSIESTQFGLSYAANTDGDKVQEFIQQHPDVCKSKIMWMRITQSGKVSVQVGHQVTDKLLPEEQNAFVQDYNDCHSNKVTAVRQIMDDLNKIPTRCLTNDGGATLTVLSWDDMAAYHARHIMAAAAAEYEFLNKKWGVTDEAQRFLRQTCSTFANTNLLPVALSEVDLDRDTEVRKIYFDSLGRLIEQHPEQIVAYDWLFAAYGARNAALPAVQNLEYDWFTPQMPMGTAYAFDSREDLPKYKLDLAQLTSLREISPFNESICKSYAKAKYGRKLTAAELSEAYVPLCEYSLSVMRSVAQREYDDPAKYIASYEKIAALDPQAYLRLGQYCVQHDDEAGAVKYFEHALKECTDAVAMSNSSEWIAIYDLNHGKKSDAMKIADDGAKVYSAMGLRCRAIIAELTGDLPTAEKTYNDSITRYGDRQKPALTAFYQRNASKDKAYAEKAATQMRQIFPNGMQKLDTASMSGPPQNGVLISETSDFGYSKGMHRNNIIVGLNGYRVENKTQFYLLQNLPIDPRIKVTYWDKSKYADLVVPTISGNRLSIQSSDYPNSSGKPSWN